MHNSQISMILSLKAGTYYWEADVNCANLRNLSLIFKTPQLGYGACDYNVAKSTCLKRLTNIALSMKTLNQWSLNR